jgi:hypothetical protein
MSYDDELLEKQIKNLKRKVVAWVWECPPTRAIQLALFCGVKIPKNLIGEFILQQSLNTEKDKENKES